MKSLKEQIDDLMLGGYSTDTARAKVVHDAVLLAMHKSRETFEPFATRSIV